MHSTEYVYSRVHLLFPNGGSIWQKWAKTANSESYNWWHAEGHWRRVVHLLHFLILCDIFWMAKFLNSPFTFLEYVCICLHWIILENILPDQNLLTYATYSITSSTCPWRWSTSGGTLRWWITSSIVAITSTNFVWKSNHRKNIH